MTTRFRRKRVKNIRLTNSKSYGNAALRVKLCICGTERCWGQNRGTGKHSACPLSAHMAQALHPVSSTGVQCWQCVQHWPVLSVSGADGPQVLQCAERRHFFFHSLTVGAADPWNYKSHQLKSMPSQNLIWKCCLPPVFPPLPHLGVEELCQSWHALDVLEWIRQTFSLESRTRLLVPLFSLLLSSQMCA